MDTIREDIPIPFSSADSSPSTRSVGLTQVGAKRSGVGRVRTDLERFGPGCSIPVVGVDEAFAYCQQLALAHYENFSVVTGLVPKSLRPHFCSIYAYCRWSDDLADEMDSPEQATELLTWWRAGLEACFQSNSWDPRDRHPVYRALRHSIAVHDLPKEPFEALLSAFLQDQTKIRYATDGEVLDYCRRSANPVGRLVLGLANLDRPELHAWSDSICTGLQLANFCQDVPVDARRGRIYLPRERMDRHAIDEEILRQGSDPKCAQAIREWAWDARSMLIAGLPMVAHGPRWLARSIQLFARGGVTLLDNILAAQGNVWNRPITVSKTQKLRLIAQAFVRPRSVAIAPVHEERMTRDL